MRVSRREILAGAGVALGAQACTTSTDDTADETPATIDHIIVVMMENRSFDHFLGAMTLLEGRDDLDGLTADMENAGDDGVPVAPYPNEIACIADPGHGWDASHGQYNGGVNDGFVRDYGGPGVMQYMQRSDLPITWALADQYAVCDAYFCSVMGPTWPNRFYGHAGTSNGMRSNDWPPDGCYDMPTVWSKLIEAGIDGRYYYTDLPFQALFCGAYDVSRRHMLEDFVFDAELGSLAAVTWIDPGFAFNDDHPPHHVALGQEFLALVYKALSRSPQWDRCLLLITYDEHGGFFDHVPPPLTDDDHAAEGFDQLGFRVPVIAIGPYVKQGVVSTTFDHTSWLKLVCDRFGIEPWTKRIAAAKSLAAVLDTERMARREPMPPIELPVFDFDDDALPEGCDGQGVMGPPPPKKPKRPATAPVLPEVWHDLMKHVYREEDRTQEWERLALWIRAYVRDEAPPRFRRG